MAKRSTDKSKKTFLGGKAALAIGGGISLLVGGILYGLQPTGAAEILVYKSPTCGCCGEWVNHLKRNGFTVEVHDRLDMRPIKREFGVPGRLQSCHTAQVDGYVIEGHVPASDIARLLREKPSFKGLAAPGMPMGSPGMEGPRSDPYAVLAIQPDGATSVYARHNQ